MEIEWSSKDLDLKTFTKRYDKYLPMIVRVVDGFCGLDELDDNTYSRDEEYRISHLKRQPRIIAQDEMGRHISLPISYPLHFYKVTDTGSQDAMPLGDLVERLYENDQFMAKDDGNIEFWIGAQKKTSINLGILKFVAEYSERYLVASTINEGELNEESVIIPVYIPIRISIAEGVKGGSPELFDKFKDTLAQTASRFKPEVIHGNSEIMLFEGKLTEYKDYDYMKPSNYMRCGQAAFQPVAVQPAAVQPTAVEPVAVRPAAEAVSLHSNSPHSGTKQERGTLDSGTNQSRPDLPKKQLPSTLPKSRSMHSKDTPEFRKPPSDDSDDYELPNTIKPKITPRAGKPPEVVPRRTTSMLRCVRREMPPTPDNHPGKPFYQNEIPRVSVKPNVHSSSVQNKPIESQVVPEEDSGDFYEDIDTNTMDQAIEATSTTGNQRLATEAIGIARNQRLASAPDISHPFGNPRIHRLTSAPETSATCGSQTENISVPQNIAENNHTGDTVATPRLSTSDQGNKESAQPDTEEHPPEVKEEATMSEYVSASDVPKNLDFKNMTVKQVGRCLMTLKMTSYIETLEDKDIDGEMLCDLLEDEQILVDDLGFKRIDAKKLKKFVLEGWRPNVN